MPMNYNNYFPAGYQPIMYQPQNQMVPQQQNQSAGITWVQGEAGAKAYPVAAGSSVLLMDSENECFYIKSTDVSGMPLPLRSFSFKEIVGQTNSSPVEKSFDPNEYVTKSELERRLNELKKSYKKEVNRG